MNNEDLLYIRLDESAHLSLSSPAFFFSFGQIESDRIKSASLG